GVVGGLRVVQLAERDHLAGGLLDPVATGDAEVEQALGDIAGDLLRAQDADLVDAGVDDVGPVVDDRVAAHPQVGRLEQLEGRLLERALGEHQLQHAGNGTGPRHGNPNGNLGSLPCCTSSATAATAEDGCGRPSSGRTTASCRPPRWCWAWRPRTHLATPSSPPASLGWSPA